MCNTENVDYSDRLYDIQYALEAIAREFEIANKLKEIELILAYGERKVNLAKEQV